VDLVKDTTINQDDNNSVYSIHSEVEGRLSWARVQKGSRAAPIYVMNGAYSGYLNMRMSLESGNASILTCPAREGISFIFIVIPRASIGVLR